MALSRRERRERRHAEGQSGPRQNEAAAHSPVPYLNGQAGERLLVLLLERDLVTEEQVEEVLAQESSSGADPVEALVRLRALDEGDLIAARAELYGMPVADLGQTNSEAEALALIPDSIAREHHVIPIALDDMGLRVAVANQPSPELLALLAETSGRSIIPMLAPLPDIGRAIDSNYRTIRGLEDLVQAFEAVEVSRRRPDASTSGPEVVDDNAPVVQVVGRILTQAMRDRASDIHIEPSELGIRVRYRIDGALKEVLTLPCVHGRRTDKPHQDHGRNEHRRAPQATGWTVAHGDRRQRGRRTRRDRRHDLGREMRHAGTRPDTFSSSPERTGHAEGCGRYLFGVCPSSLWNGSLRGANWKRQDDDAVCNAHRDRRRLTECHDDRGPGRIRVSEHQPDSDKRTGRTYLRHGTSLHFATRS